MKTILQNASVPWVMAIVLAVACLAACSKPLEPKPETGVEAPAVTRAHATIPPPPQQAHSPIDWCARLNFQLPRKPLFFDHQMTFVNDAGEFWHTRPLDQKRHLGRTYKRFGLYSGADSLLFTSDYFWFKEGEYSEVEIDEKESYPISREINFKTGEIEKRRNQKTLNDIYVDRFEWEISKQISCEGGKVTNWLHTSFFSRMPSHSPPPKVEPHIQQFMWSNVYGLMGFQIYLDGGGHLLYRIPRPAGG